VDEARSMMQEMRSEDENTKPGAKMVDEREARTGNS
jgi:hypothetical protein